MVGDSVTMATGKAFGDTVDLADGVWNDKNGDIHSGTYTVLGADYLMKKNGDVVNNDQNKTPVSGTLYYDLGCSKVYTGDYSMIRTDSKYSTDNEVRIDGVTYHKDGYGNLYYDWLGTPTELPNNRGYSWTFLLKDNLDLVIYTKEIAYSINFVVNGKLVKASDLNAVSTVAPMNSGLDAARDLAQDDTVDLDSNTWYSGKTGTAVTKVNNQYVLSAENIEAHADDKGFITLYKTANAMGTYTVVKVDSKSESMYRCLYQGDSVDLDSNTWYSGKTGTAVTTVENQYVLSAENIEAHADDKGFIVLYRVAPSSYTVLKVDDAKDYRGTDITQYTTVAFDGPVSNRGITWYTDPDYNNEYSVHNANNLLSPERYVVDIILPTDPSVNDNTFNGWKLFGSGSYAEAQSVALTGGSKHLEAGTQQDPVRNYFYIFDANWQTPGSNNYDYKIVYASQYTYKFSDGSISNVDYYKTGDYTLKNITETGFNGWKVWNTGKAITGGTPYTPKNADAVTVNGIKYILMVADWGDDLTYANNVVYASEYGFVPHMDSVRKYQCNVTRNITLYGHTGTYILYLHDFNDEYDPLKYELIADEFNQISIPNEYHQYSNYLFVGWSAYSTDGKREYTYAPEESIYVDNLKERIDMYPYFLSDSSGVKYYDGQQVTVELTLDDVLAKKQALTKGDAQATDIKVRYSHTEIDDVDDSKQEDSDVYAKHVGVYTIYYAAEMKTPKGKTGSNTYGNTVLKYPFHGVATLKVLQVDAFVIAPSASLKEGDGSIIAVSDPSQITMADTSGGNIALTSEDVVLIGLAMSDVKGTKLYTGQSDKTEGMTKTTYNVPGQWIVKGDIVFTDEEQSYYATDYNLKFIDGSLVIYPRDSSKYEGDENV